MVIYYWTSTDAGNEEAYDIVYSGEVRKISKITKQDYRGWRAIRTDRQAGELVRMTVESLDIDRASGSPVILLKRADIPGGLENPGGPEGAEGSDEPEGIEGDVYLPIWIGNNEAFSIALALEQVEYPRPLTHDLMVDIIDSLSVRITSVEINDILFGTYYAVINLEMLDGKELAIDSRPSDAIAIALRTGCEIYTSSVILDIYGVRFESQEETTLKF